jgi:hypothetical protein
MILENRGFPPFYIAMALANRHINYNLMAKAMAINNKIKKKSI